MRLATISTPSGPRAAIQVGKEYIDLHATDSTLPSSVRELLAANESVRDAALRAGSSPSAVKFAAESVRLLPPIPDPGKIICVGMNYRDHVLEFGRAIPTEPVLFSKFRNTLIAHGDATNKPNTPNKVDYGVCLVVCFGKRGKHIADEENAWGYVGGYTCGNDVSARDWQYRGEAKQWMIGKTFDTFAPTGPTLITRDEIPEPHRLAVRLRLNGQTMQDSNTREFIFGIPTLLAFISQAIELEPGDLIFTGTPPGVGSARKPPIFLKDGDLVEVDIEGVGVLTNRCEVE